MPKQVSVIKLQGTIDDMTFYKNECGFLAKKKGGPTPAQIKEEDYENALRNAAEWKRATAAAKLLRISLWPLLNGMKSMKLNGRMNAPFLKAVQADTVSTWGERNMELGDPAVVNGFEFNPALLLEDALPVNLDNHFVVAPDKIDLQLPAFRLRSRKGLPDTSTHYRLVSGVVSLDFGKQHYTRDFHYSPLQAMGRRSGAPFTATHQLTALGTGSYWVVCIEFYKMVNDKPCLLQGGACKLMQWMEPASEVASGAGINTQDVAVPAGLPLAITDNIASNMEVVAQDETRSLAAPHNTPNTIEVRLNYVVAGDPNASGHYHTGNHGWFSSY